MWCETEAFYNYTVSWSQLERDGLDSHSGLCDVKLRLFTTTLVSWSQLETIKSGLQSGPRHQLCSLCLCRTSHSEAVLLQSEVSYHSYPGRQRSRFHRGLPASWQRHSMLWLARRPLQIRAELATQPSVATFPAFRFFCSLKATYLGRLCACWVHWVLGNPGCNVSRSDSDQPIWDFSSLGMWESLQHWHLLAEKETAGTTLQQQNYRMSVRPRSDHRMQRKGPWLRKSLGQDHIE